MQKKSKSKAPKKPAAAKPARSGKRAKAVKRAKSARPSKAAVRRTAVPAQGQVPWFTKRYLKSRPVCKVTFRLPAEAAEGANRVALVGDFNDWNIDAVLMRRLRSGEFTATVDLPAGREYRYRYFIDGCRWENDWCPDRYAPNPFGGDDSIIAV